MVFRNDPILIPTDDGEWKLFAELRYQTRTGQTLTIPHGFITDLASIPRVFHSLIPVNGKHRAAAIVHDYLYVTQIMTRAESDRIFLEAMEDLGVRWNQRWAMYSAVRVGGWLPWRKNTRAIAEDFQNHMRANGLL